MQQGCSQKCTGWGGSMSNMAMWMGSQGWTPARHWRWRCTQCTHGSVLTHTCVCTGKCTTVPSVGSPCRHTSEHVSCRDLGTHIPLSGHWTLDHGGGLHLVEAGQGHKHCGHGSTGKGQDELAHHNPHSVSPTPQQEEHLLPPEPSVALQG